MHHLLIAALAVLSLSTPSFAADAKPAQPRTPVLVELFTSEGCSSCPPADALLSRLQNEQPIPDAQIIVLGEHVDYWDGLGWRDRFSSSQLTARQNEYGARFRLNSVYTPQMIVDGTAQFVGNDQTAAWRAIASAAHSKKLSLIVSTLTRTGNNVSGSVRANAVGTLSGDLYAALVEPMASTEVHRGENSGRKLQHVAVVRSLMRIGSTRDLARGPVDFTVAAPEGSNSSHGANRSLRSAGESWTCARGDVMSAIRMGRQRRSRAIFWSVEQVCRIYNKDTAWQTRRS